MKQLHAAFLLFFFCLNANAQGNRIYVRAAAVGGNTGNNWADAFNDLQNALSIAEAGDTIWLAEGIYRPTNSSDRSIAFGFKSKIVLYGGFAGNETNLNQRDWAQHISTLSGDIGVANDSTDNSFTILYMENPDTGTLVDGVHFVHGIANDPVYNPYTFIPSKCGGAVFIQAQGGIGYPDFVNCTFYRNYALYHGGAVCASAEFSGSVAPRFLNCIFKENRSGFNGTAVTRYGGSGIERYPDFSNCLFENNLNTLYSRGTILWGDGPGIDSLQIENCTFENNSGGIEMTVGRTSGMKCKIENVDIINCKFGVKVVGNNSFFVDYLLIRNCNISEITGGEILNLQTEAPPPNKISKIIVEKSNFEFNSVGANSSFLKLTGVDSLNISGCNFNQNQGGSLIESSFSKGGILMKDVVLYFNTNPRIIINSYNSPGNKADLINVLYERNTLSNAYYGYFEGTTSVNLQNCTFVRNKITVPNLASVSGQTLTFKNCAFWKNQNYNAHIFDNYPLGVSFEHCYFETLNVANLPTNITLGSGNLIGDDPLFVNSDQSDGSYRLQPCSPLIDAGDNTGTNGILNDLDGNPRVLGGFIDIGAYETPALAFTGATLVQSNCAEPSNATLSFQTDHGCTPYSFQWQSGDSTGTGISNLRPGLYYFTITDSRGQAIADTVNIFPPPELNVSVTPVDCATGQGGLVLATVAFGAYPFAFHWSNGLTDSVLYNIPAGGYDLTLTDAQGCRDSAILTIELTNNLLLFSTINDATGPQTPDGAIRIDSLLGGLDPFTFIWNTGDHSDHLDGLLPGVYTVTISDANGCTRGQVFEVGFTSDTQNADSQVFMNVYPSPASETLNVSIDLDQNRQLCLALLDLYGRELLSFPEQIYLAGRNIIVLQTAQFPPGIYQVNIRSAVSNKSIKFSVLR